MSFIVKKAPDWKPSPVVETWTNACMEGLAKQISDFLQRTAEQVMDPSVVTLYTESRTNIPGLDAELLIHSSTEHTIRVFFNRKEIASCLFLTTISDGTCTHVAIPKQS